MSKRTNKTRPIDPDDVLAGRAKASAAELLELIHRANPTGRDLPAREEASRYAMKARLQSLLVRRFSDELTVLSDPDHEGTVTLRHGEHGRDACHAVIAALDEDARAWVQLQVDLGAGTPEPSEPRATGRAPRAVEVPFDASTPEALLRRAQAAIDAYDYEAAQADLTLAVEKGDGGAEPAALLLSLLVETLGDDAGALAIEGRLSRAALADAGVRGMLALAAARTGDEGKALPLLRGASDTQAAAALAALAGAAAARGDADHGANLLEQARKRDPASPAIAGVAGEIAKARAAARGPLEEKLAALVAVGSDDEAEKLAAQVLSHWPESEAARRAGATIEARRRRGDAARHAAAAEAALAAGSAATAIEELRKGVLAARGAEREAMERRLAEIEAEGRARREAAEVDRVSSLLEAGASIDACLAYLALGEALRARVRAGDRPLPREELAALDAVAAGRASDRAKVDAALALVHAQALVSEDPEAARALLAAHEATLERAPAARRITRRVEESLHAVQREKARAAVRRARQDLDAGLAAEAAARLDADTLRALPEAERLDAEALAARATRLAERRRRAEAVAPLRASGRLFEARAGAAALAASAEDGERARWERERDAIHAEIQQVFRLEVNDAPEATSELSWIDLRELYAQTRCWLTADGEAMVLSAAYGRWVIIRVLRPATMEIRPTVLLRAPEPLGQLEAVVHGRSLWLVGTLGPVVEVGMDPWEVLDYRPRADVAAPSDFIERLDLAAPDDASRPRHLWVDLRTTVMGATRTRVIDLEQRRVAREVMEGWGFSLVIGAREGRVVVRRDQTCVMHTSRGAVAPEVRLDHELNASGVAVHPHGSGWVALGKKRVTSYQPDDMLQLADLAPTGALRGWHEIVGSKVAHFPVIASASAHGMAFALVRTDDTQWHATGVAFADGRMEKRWEARLDHLVALVADAGARRVLALALHDGGADVVELGPTPPDLPARREHRVLKLPGRLDVISCGRATGELAKEVSALSMAAHDGHTAWMFDQRPATPEQLAARVLALREMGTDAAHEDAQRLSDRVWRDHRTHPLVRLTRANERALEADWSDVSEALQGLDLEPFEEAQRKHIHHLRALAAVFEGRHDEARAEVLAAQAIAEGKCELDVLAVVTGAAAGHGANTELLTELIAAVREADALLEQGDHRGATRALDISTAWLAREVQSGARLAEAYLGLEPRTHAERVRKLAALANFSEAHVDARRTMGELTIPTAWKRERLAEIAERAEAWIELAPPLAT